MPVPASAKRAATVAAALLLGAPTAGAALRSEAPAQTVLADGLLKIEYVVPPEPEVHPVYPLATFDAPPVNDYKRPPRAAKWGYGFLDVQPVSMTAEPPGDYDNDRSSENLIPRLHNSFEPASGWLDD